MTSKRIPPLAYRGWRASHSSAAPITRRLVRSVTASTPLINAAAGFDFNEYHHATTPGDDVDLAEWRFPPPLQDAVGFRDQNQRRAAFRGQAALEGGDPFRTRQRLRRRERFSAARHVWDPFCRFAAALARSGKFRDAAFLSAERPQQRRPSATAAPAPRAASPRFPLLPFVPAPAAVRSRRQSRRAVRRRRTLARDSRVRRV